MSEYDAEGISTAEEAEDYDVTNGKLDTSTRFKQVYANLPLGLRKDIIAVIDGEPMTWQVCYVEVNCDTPMAERILKYLDKMEFI